MVMQPVEFLSFLIEILLDILTSILANFIIYGV